MSPRKRKQKGHRKAMKRRMFRNCLALEKTYSHRLKMLNSSNQA